MSYAYNRRKKNIQKSNKNKEGRFIFDYYRNKWVLVKGA